MTDRDWNWNWNDNWDWLRSSKSGDDSQADCESSESHEQTQAKADESIHSQTIHRRALLQTGLVALGFTGASGGGVSATTAMRMGARISVPGTLTGGLGADDRYLYAATKINGSKHLSKVSIASGEEQERLSPAFDSGAAGYGAGTTPESRLFAADFNTSRVLEVDPVTGETSGGFDVFFDPAGVTYDPDRESLWISNITTNQVHEFSVSGTERGSFNTQSTTTPAGIAYHNGFVWLGDKEDPSHLYKYATDGQLRDTREVGPTINGAGGNSDGVITPDGTGNAVFTVGDPHGSGTPGTTDEVWSQQQKLTASDGVDDDLFGRSVGLSDDGTTALIGAPEDNNPNGENAGSAYVFSRSEGAWSQQQKLTASDGESRDRFGGSVGLSDDGTTALIGAAGDDDSTGSAYVFSRSEGTWSQQQKLTVSNRASDDSFGFPVGLSDDGTTALIGASGDDDLTGSAYVFSRSEGAWSQQQKLTAADGESNDFFGLSVGLSDDGTTALIGAARDDDLTGSAYVFSRSEGAWSQQQKLTASNRESNDFFGGSVGLSDGGTTALIGAPGDGDETGSAYVFSRSEGAWSQQQKLTASNRERGDLFGGSVGLSDGGTTALIGAPEDDDPNGRLSGSAYVFSRSEGAWSQQQKLTASDGKRGDRFGFSGGLSDDGTTALIGGFAPPLQTATTGSAYVFMSEDSTPASAPTAEFDITDPVDRTPDTDTDTDTDTEVGIQLEFAASASPDPDGSIARYEWDFTSDGTTDVTTTDPVVTRSFDSIGERQITLRVVNTQGRAATATQSLTVHLRDYFETLTTARQIDTRSTLSVVNQVLESLPDAQTVTGAEQRAQQTVTALETAVQEERLQQPVAQEAVNRLLVGQQGVLLTVNRTGTGTVEIGEPSNLSLLVVEQAVNTLIGIVITVEAARVQLNDNVFGFLSDAVRFILSKLETTVDTVLTLLLGSGETKRTVTRQLTAESVRIVDEISGGELSTAEEIQTAATDAADALTELVTAGLQVYVDFDTPAEEAVVGSGSTTIDPVSGAILEFLSERGATYETVATLNNQLQPPAVSGGLPGTAETVQQNVEAHREAINSTVATAVGVIERIGIATSEISLFETVLDLYDRDRDPPLEELLSVLGTAANILIGGVASIVSNGAAGAIGFGTLIYLKNQQATLIDGVLAGEEVPFVSV